MQMLTITLKQTQTNNCSGNQLKSFSDSLKFKIVVSKMTKSSVLIVILFAWEISGTTVPVFWSFNSRVAIPKPDKIVVKKCLSLGDMMPAFNQSSRQFNCFTLATSGPCNGETFWHFWHFVNLKMEAVRGQVYKGLGTGVRDQSPTR